MEESTMRVLKNRLRRVRKRSGGSPVWFIVATVIFFLTCSMGLITAKSFAPFTKQDETYLLECAVKNDSSKSCQKVQYKFTTWFDQTNFSSDRLQTLQRLQAVLRFERMKKESTTVTAHHEKVWESLSRKERIFVLKGSFES